MACNRTIVLALAIGLSIPAAVTPAAGEYWGGGLTLGFDESEVDAFQAAIQRLLREDQVGASRPWYSASGRSGRVYLVRGGEKAGSSEAMVRITRLSDKRELNIFVFKYCNSPALGWATCG